MSTGVSISQPTVEYIQMDSLVIMKIVKHVDSELYAGMSEVAGEACQGLLTGLVSVEENRLEITNCFPTARAEPILESDENAIQANQAYEDLKNQEIFDMLKKFRNMNIDYELAGFYQAHPFGACFTQDLVDSMFDYQSASSGQDRVVIIYDPVKTRQGQLCLRAYRLSLPALQLYSRNDWSPEAVRAANLTYESMFEELPIVIKSNHLVNVMMAELSLSPTNVADRYSAHLELGTRRSLEKSVRGMMANIDELNKSISAYAKYVSDKQKHENNIFNLTQKRQLENEQRQARGEPPLSMDDIRKMKPPLLQTRNGMLEAMLSSCHTQALADFCTTVTGENMAKLFLAEAIADDKGTNKDRSQSTVSSSR